MKEVESSLRDLLQKPSVFKTMIAQRAPRMVLDKKNSRFAIRKSKTNKLVVLLRICCEAVSVPLHTKAEVKKK